LIDQLFENKLLGYRGHDKWDKFAFILIFFKFGLAFSYIISILIRIIELIYYRFADFFVCFLYYPTQGGILFIYKNCSKRFK